MPSANVPASLDDQVSAAPSDGVLYFSYGSNMSREKLASRAGFSDGPITYTSCSQARLRDWGLCFDLRGAPPSEPAMGSIQREPGDVVYGVVYTLLDEQTWHRLLVTEGVTTRTAVDSYHVIEVDVECLSPAGEVAAIRTAKTLMTNPNQGLSRTMQRNVRPSRRYVNVLIEGAVKEGLPDDYVERLRNVRVARKWNPSPLRFLMNLAVPALWLLRQMKIRFLATPLWKLGIDMYAAHEAIMCSERCRPIDTVYLAMLRVALIALYAVYAFPVLLLFLFDKRSRDFYTKVISLFNEDEQRQKGLSKDARSR